MSDSNTEGLDPKRRAAREIRWLANSLKGMLALADQLGEEADLDKLAAARDARLAAVEAKLATLEPHLADVETQLALKAPKLAAIESRLLELRRNMPMSSDEFETNAAETSAADATATPSTGEVAVENLRVGVDAEVGFEQQEHDALMTRLSQSTYSRSLSPRDAARAKENIVAYDAMHGPDKTESIAAWVGDDDARFGYIMQKAARGELPGHVPSAAELDAIGVQIAARKELDQIYRDFPPGTPGHTERLPRIGMLWNIESGGTPLVGKSLRRV
jgi:hypothetical protein